MPYDVALICKNGHLVNSYFHKYSENNSAFCQKCGAPTISKCPYCNHDIRGHSIGEFSYLTNYNVPAYCIYCGKPFPWVEAAIANTALIIKEEDALSESQQNALIEVLPDIVVETPNTNLAAVRLKKFLASAGKFTAESVRQFAIDFGCELGKKLLGL